MSLMSAYVIQRQARAQRATTRPRQRVDGLSPWRTARDLAAVDVLPRLDGLDDRWSTVAPVERYLRGATKGLQPGLVPGLDPLGVSLELVKEGAMDVRQKAAFSKRYI
jgi:hypothetical protein